MLTESSKKGNKLSWVCVVLTELSLKSKGFCAGVFEHKEGEKREDRREERERLRMSRQYFMEYDE